MSMKYALCALLLSTARAGDISEKLSREAAADDKVIEDAKCWCKDFQEVLASRGREQEFQERHLGSQKSQEEAANNVLRLEIQAHQTEAAKHQESLDTKAAIDKSAKGSLKEEKEFHETVRASVQKAMDALPENGKSKEVRDALRGLEQTATKKIEDAEKKQDTKMAGLRGAKEEMLRLAKEGEATKSDRLTEGVAAVDQASTKYDHFTSQGEADRALDTSLQDLCSAISSEAASRQRLRQQAAIAVSEANVKLASAAAAKASSKLVLSSSRMEAHISEKDDASDLAALVARSTAVQSEMTKMLSAIVLDAHLLDGKSGVDPAVKAALASLGKEADANAQNVPKLFDAVRAQGGESIKADKVLVPASS